MINILKFLLKKFILFAAQMIGSQRSDEPRNSGRKRNNRNRDRDGKRRKKCKKQRYRDYFIEEHGCRSKKPYKMAKCVGSGT